MQHSVNSEIWFVTGSQHLYGQEALKQVADDTSQVATALNNTDKIPVDVRDKGVVTRSDEILSVCREANAVPRCVGLIFWMHTFSPGKMWIAGLNELKKPFLHLHTQLNRELPWQDIDMDFINLNQSAHGGREFGFICTRLGKNRKVVVGHWQDERAVAQIGSWARTACGVAEMQTLKVARFGDNMRNVAVTEGDKVAAEAKFGFSVSGYGIGDLRERIEAVLDNEVDELVEQYNAEYDGVQAILADENQREAVRREARIEAGLRAFLQEGGYSAFTDTFEDLHGLSQLPGLAVQRLMAEGYGFGAEGDWKTAALLRVMKVMSADMPGGTSFMEDYTYDLTPGKERVLGAHMLEVCPTIAGDTPRLHVHPLGIGGKDDPVRLIFQASAGRAVNASLVDLGDRFRLVVNEVETEMPEGTLPNLPVARALWKPLPDLETAAASWILAGGAHHTVFSQSLGVDYLENLAEMFDLELVVIDRQTKLRDLKKELRWNKAAF